MWQIQYLKRNQNDKDSHQNIRQTFTWKYGRITLSNHQQIQDINPQVQKQILITTHPFVDSNVDMKTKNRIIFIQSNQQNKSLENVQKICRQLMKYNANRQSNIYIKGGGMLLDLAGFACSIYMRGINNIVFVPTTLLAVVDATVGGKNGINWSGVKNFLGVVRHPHQIRISLHYLDSLTDRQFSNGMAQVIKMAITHDKRLFQLLQNQEVTLKTLRSNQQLLRQIIKRSLQIKVKVVQNDQFEKGERKWLNFGHTVGHGLQLSKGGSRFMHGECVALGMIQEILLGQKLKQITDQSILLRVQKVLKKFNLPTKIPKDIQIQQVINLMTKDKKNNSAKSIKIALIDQIGKRKQSMTSVPVNKIQQHFLKKVFINIDEKVLKGNVIKNNILLTNKKWQEQNKFPGSKSLSIRYLFLTALYFIKSSGKTIKIINFLQSDDTTCIKSCLRSLGFAFTQNQADKQIQITTFQSRKKGILNVGNSGLTARFVLPLCAYLQGQWTIQCHPRMSQRPNQQIFKFCKQLYDCSFQWSEKGQDCFPVKITTKGIKRQNRTKYSIQIDSQQSSQFTSSVLLNCYLFSNQSKTTQIIIPSGKIVSQSYIKMTIKCLQTFDVVVNIAKNEVSLNSHKLLVKTGQSRNQLNQIQIQRDLSSFSYPYALTIIHNTQSPIISQNSCQGDVLFYKYCQEILHKKCNQKHFNKQSQLLQLQFSQCTDTFMTFAAIIATNINNRFEIGYRGIKIKGIANQRIKQSNRIEMIIKNLQKIGYYVQQTSDGLILPITDKQGRTLLYRKFNQNEHIVFQVRGDHRLAMSMSILSSFFLTIDHIRQSNVKFIIDDKDAVNKTFPQFWQYLKQIGINLSYNINKTITANSTKSYTPRRQTNHKVNKIVILGNRGSGKTSISKQLVTHYKDSYVIDLDQQITKQIISTDCSCKTIKQFVQARGWDQFRTVEYRVLDKYVSSPHLQNIHIASNSHHVNFIISTGGGVVDWQNSLKLLSDTNKKRQTGGDTKITNIYLEKDYKQLQIQHNQNRPYIQNFKQVFERRSKKYEQIANYIITIPKSRNQNNKYKEINQYVMSQFDKIMNENSNKYQLKQGFIYCVPRVYVNKPNIDLTYAQNMQAMDVFQSQMQNFKNSSQNYEKISGVELRIDSIANQLAKLNALHSNNNNLQQSNHKLIKLCRYAIAQFKLKNNKILSQLCLPILLTLRSKQQYGMYPIFAENQPRAAYHTWLQALKKIPHSYIDYQWNRYDNKRDHIERNQTNYIYSYHGGDANTISDMLQYLQFARQADAKRDLIKVCFKGEPSIWNKYKDEWRSNSDICINLDDPLSRIHPHNKFKMIIANADHSGVITIPNFKQIGMLRMLRRFFPP